MNRTFSGQETDAGPNREAARHAQNPEVSVSVREAAFVLRLARVRR